MTVSGGALKSSDSSNKSAKGASHSKESLDNSQKLSKLGLPILQFQQRTQENNPEWATPGVRPEDFIKGMKESDQTALNTKEYVFYGYFQRIRERLDRAWIPLLRARLIRYFHTGRRLASQIDHTTRVQVILNERGEIIRVQVVGESGVKDLDDTAIKAFNAAGPFPNPPKGIVDANQEIQFIWDLVLKT